METQESGETKIIENDSAETVTSATENAAKKVSNEQSSTKKDSSDKAHSEKNQKDGSGDKNLNNESRKSNSRFPKRRFEQDSNNDRNKKARYSWQAGQTNHQGRSNSNQGGRLYPGQVLIKESEVGISQFIGSHKGFDGLFKQKFSDIVINEITLSGEVVKIGNTAIPELAAVDIAFIPKKVKPNLQGLLDGTETEPVEVPVEKMSKDDQSKLHLAIRALSSKLLTATVEKDGKAIISTKLKDPNENVTEEQVWPVGVGDYVYFVVHKENIDTTAAITQISQLLRINEKLLSFSDVKERNAKATQMASVFRIEPERMNALNKKLKNMTLGNFSYQRKQLQVGDLSANSYQLAFRNTTAEIGIVEECVKSLQENGFINYFGMGTFGPTSVPNYHVGRALIKWNWKDVVDYVLKPRDGGEDNLRYIRKLYSNTRDASKALRPLLNKQSIEGRLLQGLVKHQKSLVKAVRMIPRSLRAMHVNSYQSYIWNTIASKRIEKHGLKPIVGDLIVRGPLVEQVCDGWFIKEEEKIEIDLAETKKETSSKDEQSEKEDKSEKEEKSPNKDKSKKDKEEEDKQTDENNKEKSDEKDAKPAEDGNEEAKKEEEVKKEEVKEELIEAEEGWEEDGRYRARVEVVTETNVDKFTIYDVVLPLPGYHTKYPENEVAEWYKEIFEKDGVDFSNMDKLKVYALTGSYRRLVVKPSNVSWKTVNYTNAFEPLILTDYDHMVHKTRTGEVPDGKLKAVVLELSIPPASHVTSAVREVLKRAATEPPPRPVIKRDATDSKKVKSDTPQEESNKTDVAEITESAVDDSSSAIKIKTAGGEVETKSAEANGSSVEVEGEPMEA